MRLYPQDACPRDAILLSVLLEFPFTRRLRALRAKYRDVIHRIQVWKDPTIEDFAASISLPLTRLETTLPATSLTVVDHRAVQHKFASHTIRTTSRNRSTSERD